MISINSRKMDKDALSESVPSWKGQLNIAKSLNGRFGLGIPDEVFSDLNIAMMGEKERPNVPDRKSAVLILDIKLDTPHNTLEVIMELMHCRHNKCIVSDGIFSNENALQLWPTVDWRPGVSWKVLDLTGFHGQSASYVRNQVGPERLPTTSVAWFMFFGLIDTDGINIPFFRSPGFHINGNNGSLAPDRTLGFQSIEDKFSVCCTDVSDEAECWTNPVLC